MGERATGTGRRASVDDLVAAGLDADAVAFLADADPAERGALLDALDGARRRRARELAEAVDAALGFVPRPLRGRLVRALRPPRR